MGHRAGQRWGAGVGSPEGCFTITVRRHGARMYSMCVSERYFKKNWMRGRGVEGEVRGWVRRSGCSDPASEYGGLILGADWAPVGVSLVQEPGGAAQGVHVCVHLQGVNLPGGGGEEEGEGGRRDERRA